MKLSNAIKKLEKAGYEISSCMGSYSAQKGKDFIDFNETSNGNCSKFSLTSPLYCTQLHGQTLKTVIID